ncbi:hypothetical protein [Streptomyces sp. PU_AKi4]|uniref:hypothetical protein n=1 Tax=Streptomyces sp. PU_AKi4 TaxID=2800809 RepID=UPI00352523D8
MPNPQDYTDRREALCAWLRANGINPNEVPIHGNLYLEPGSDDTRNIVYEAFHLTEDGHRHVDERGLNAAIERRAVPLLVEPPDWWEPYRKPTREQLLEAVDRIRSLHSDWEADPGYCAHCQDGTGTPLPWPCPTIRALEG